MENDSNDVLVCVCMGIYKSEIVQAIRENGLTTVDEVSETTEAALACGSCCGEIEDILREINGE